MVLVNETNLNQCHLFSKQFHIEEDVKGKKKKLHYINFKKTNLYVKKKRKKHVNIVGLNSMLGALFPCFFSGTARRSPPAADPGGSAGRSTAAPRAPRRPRSRRSPRWSSAGRRRRAARRRGPCGTGSPLKQGRKLETQERHTKKKKKKKALRARVLGLQKKNKNFKRFEEAFPARCGGVCFPHDDSLWNNPCTMNNWQWTNTRKPRLGHKGSAG